MRVILCLDDRNGMLFNHRRQSRDRVVIQDILESQAGKKLWIRPISTVLFQGMKHAFQVEEHLLEQAGHGDWCFVEDLALSPYKGKIESVTVYRWNRHYPADFYLDLDLKKGWRLIAQTELKGYSHEKITKEIYEP